MSRIIQNGITYSSGNEFIELVGTLQAGATTLVFENPMIKACSTIEVYPQNPSVVPTDEVVSGKLTLTFAPRSSAMEVRVRLSGGECANGGYADGNNIVYPVALPTSTNKLYKESDVNAIAVAIGKSLKISEMAEEVRGLSGGLRATRVVIHEATYTISDLEE